MEFRKSDATITFNAILLFLGAIWIHGLIIYEFGDALISLKYHAYGAIVSSILIALACMMLSGLGKRIVVHPNSILFEEFSNNPIQRKDIVSFQTRKQRLPKGGSALWLVVKTRIDSKLVSRKLLQANKLIGINGIPVCNLNMYKENPDEILNKLREWHKAA